MEKVYEGFANPKYHMWSQNILFIPLPDTSPTHTGLRKKYMATAGPELSGAVPTRPARRAADPRPDIAVQHKSPFQVERKSNSRI